MDAGALDAHDDAQVGREPGGVWKEEEKCLGAAGRLHQEQTVTNVARPIL